MNSELNSPYFKRSEFACKCGCGFDTVDAKTFEILCKVREHFDQPITINSAARCPTHNRKVGGSPRSYHIQGRACDIVVHNVTLVEVHDLLEELMAGWGGIGYYDEEGFIHFDTRANAARWTG